MTDPKQLSTNESAGSESAELTDPKLREMANEYAQTRRGTGYNDALYAAFLAGAAAAEARARLAAVLSDTSPAAHDTRIVADARIPPSEK